MRGHAHHLDRWPHVAEAALQLTPQQQRRLVFIRSERLGPDEIADLPGCFDPGPEYDLVQAGRRVP